MACGLSSVQINGILNKFVSGNKKLLTKADFYDSLGDYEYLENGVYRKLDVNEKSEISNAYYQDYIAEFNKQYAHYSKGISLYKTKKQYKDYVKKKQIATKVAGGNIEKYFTEKINEAYKFKGEKRERMLREVNAEIHSLEKPLWKSLLSEWTFVRPLFSMKFALSSLIANGMVSRSVNILVRNKASEKIKAELNEFKKVLNRSILSGGLPASESIKLSEQRSENIENFTPSEIGAEYSDNKIANKYFNLTALFSKYGSRVINWTDSNVGYHGEQLYYSMLTDKETQNYKEVNNIDKLTEKDKAEISKIVAVKMFGNEDIDASKNNAEQEVESMYSNAGYAVNDTRKVDDKAKIIGRNSAEYKRAVYESMAKTKDLDVLSASNKMAMRHFFKGNMSPLKTKSGIDRVDVGLMGYINIHLFALGEVLQKKRHTSIFADQVILGAVGFINGASHFAENVLETTAYGWIKAATMKWGTNAETVEEQLYKSQRVRDLTLKPVLSMITSAIILSAAKIASDKLCGTNKAQTLSNQDIQNGKELNFCGYKLPAYLFGMQSANVVGLNYFYNVLRNKEDVSVNDIGAMAFVLMNQRDQAANNSLTKFISDKINGKSFESQERNVVQGLVTGVMNLGNPFIPFPNRPINEISSAIATEREGSISFKFKDGFVAKFENTPQYALWAGLQMLGIKEIAMSKWGSSADTKVYDYRGRPMLNGTMSFSVADGIQYDEKDDLINKLGLDDPKLIFNSPYRVLYTKDSDKSKRRYMTEMEYMNVQKAGGDVFNQYIERNYEELRKMDREKAKDRIHNALMDIERETKKAVEENPNSTYENYKSKIQINDKKKGDK